MHDPSTLAFDIKWPFGGHVFHGRRSRPLFISVWHEDPLKFEGKTDCRDDDSCGWFSPPCSGNDLERIRKLGRFEYSTIWQKQAALKAGRDYAYICFEPSAYDAIYWAWRAINHSEKGHGVWQFGKERNALTAAELEKIYVLSANPIDNLRHCVSGVKDEESCAVFFVTVYRCWRGFNRPWYRHPRWHFWHWRLQIHPLQKIIRRLFHRCCVCGKPFGWNESPTGNWNGDKIWHSACDARNAASRQA